MRLASIMGATGPRAAVFTGDAFVDIYATDFRLPASIRGVLEAGPEALQAVRDLTDKRYAVRASATSTKLCAPIPDPQKIVCIGLNYRDHAIEGGKAIPTEPVVFGKFPNTLIGHGSPIVLPHISKKVDYEAELVVVIGKRGKLIAEENAMSHVAGYTIGHDVSARDWQFRGEEKQWILGKTFDTFAPCGPYLVTADEVPDPHNLTIELRLNGQTMQKSNTREFIFPIGKLIAHLSQVMTLEPGDMIFTGTPPGVGAARKPPVWLRHGDEVEVEIEGLGVLKNTVLGGEDN